MGEVLIRGRADVPKLAGNMASDRIGVRDVGENKSAREGYPPGAIFQ